MASSTPRPAPCRAQATAGQRHHNCSGTQGIRTKMNKERSKQESK